MNENTIDAPEADRIAIDRWEEEGGRTLAREEPSARPTAHSGVAGGISLR